MAKIVMVVDGQEYLYGTYLFITSTEKARVNELAMKIREERGVDVYIEEVSS